MSEIFALLAACLMTASVEPKDPACPLVWNAATDPGCEDAANVKIPCTPEIDVIAAYRIRTASGRLCGVVHQREWTNRQGARKRRDPNPWWNPYLSDNEECWPAPGESVSYCERAVDAFGNESVNCSNVYTVVGVPMQCCTSTGCAPCASDGR